MLQYSIKNLCVRYGNKENEIYAVKNVNFDINKGDIVSIIGKSGAGKSTILNVLGGLEKPTSGKVFFNGVEITNFSQKQLSALRLKSIGTVFQGCYLVSTMTVRDNIWLPSIAASNAVDMNYFNEIVARLDIGERLNHMPNQLSGGEKQRVAIARALINKPEVILADEPTGNLDSLNSSNVFNLLIDCASEYKSTLIYVTHDKEKSNLSNRKLVMKDGMIYE